MKRAVLSVGVTLVMVGCSLQPTKTLNSVTTNSMITVTSLAFTPNSSIPAKYTCDGENINPPLAWSGGPSGTKSLVLIVDDPDAPGDTWNHWLVWNINPAATSLAENAVPVNAIQGTNDSKTIGYDGPCPPSGTHRYYFKLVALDARLTLPATAKRAELNRAMAGHVLDQGQLMGTYSH